MRELKNVVERAAILSGDVITIADLPEDPHASPFDDDDDGAEDAPAAPTRRRRAGAPARGGERLTLREYREPTERSYIVETLQGARLEHLAAAVVARRRAHEPAQEDPRLRHQARRRREARASSRSSRHDRRRATPRRFECAGAAPGVLALHGFGGTPLEVELVVEVARELGLAARAPLLPGHGTRVDELAKSRFRTGRAQPRRHSTGLRRARAAHRGRALDGVAAGGPARGAAARTDDALVMLSNALWLTAPFPAWALSAVAALKIRDFSVPKIGADIADPVARRTHLTYPAQPVHAAIEVLRAGDLVRAELARVRCPALIAHGSRDRVCPVSNARRAFELLGCADKRVVVFPRSRHIITRDLDRAQLRRELSSFFSSLPAGQHGRASRFGEPAALE